MKDTIKRTYTFQCLHIRDRDIVRNGVSSRFPACAFKEIGEKHKEKLHDTQLTANGKQLSLLSTK